MKSPREILERNLKRAHRHLNGVSTMTSDRQYAVAVDGTVITFECERSGHRRLTARLSPQACKFQASWWSKEKGGCIGACPKCEKGKS